MISDLTFTQDKIKSLSALVGLCMGHDDIIKWKHFFALLAFCAGNSLVTGEFLAQGKVTLMFSLICAWINACVNNCEAGDLRCHRTHYDVTVMESTIH